MTPPRRRATGEEGSALIIALAFVTGISLVIAAVLAFADVGIRTTTVYKQETKVAYTADGAIAAATRRYATTGPCDNFTAPLVDRDGGPGADAPINGHGVIVRCEGPPPAGAKATQPVNSLLSLGTGADGGVASTEDLRLVGDVFSNTNVTTSASATMVVQGRVSAKGTCTRTIQTTQPPLHCSNTTPPSPADSSRGRDPDYTKAADAVPVRRTAPACPAGWLVTLQPGYYDDPAALNALTSTPTGPNACNDKVVWFQPGTYYFDLTFLGGSSPWKVENETVTVVGGTPRGWDPAAATKPSPAVPGSCRTEADAPPHAGVQMIAGGGTRLEVLKGRMELCATPSTTDQQIALFGLRSPLASRTLESTDIKATGAFTDALDAQVVDEESQACKAGNTPPCVLSATAPLTAALPSGSIDFTRFRPGIPAGTLFKAADTASLVVKHRRTGEPTAVTVTVSFPGSTCGPQTLSPGTTMTTDTVNLKACGLTRPEDLNGLTAAYAATLAPGGAQADVEVDGIVVQVGYQTPVSRKPTAVVGSTPFADPARTFEIGEQPGDQPGPLTADATLPGPGGATSAAVTVIGMGDLPISPVDTVDSAVLRVAHRDEGDTGAPRVTVTFPSSTCTSLPLTHRPDAITDDRIDLRACGLDSPNRLRGLTATFTASLNPGGTAAISRLDGMWLELLMTTSSGPATPQPSAIRLASNAPLDGFANPNNARIIGEGPAPLTADATFPGGATTATQTVSNFNAIPVPPGSRIDAARLRIAHQEDANIASVGIAATVPAVAGFPGGTCPTTTLPNSVGSITPVPHELDLVPCGLASADQLAGLSATYTATRSAALTAVSRAPTATSDVAGFTAANLSRAFAIDGVGTNANVVGQTVAADARLTGNNRLATVRLSGYNQTPLPAGSTIEGASLRIAHQDVGNLAATNPVTALIGFTGSTCPTAQSIPTRPAAIAVDTIDVKALCGLTDPSQLATFNVLYSVNRGAGGQTVDDFLDGIVLDVTYRPPALAKLDGIELDLVFEAPTFRPLCAAGPSGCDLLRVAPASPADKQTRFVASGTVYAPNAGVDLKMYGLDSPVLRRGLIARSIRLGLQGGRPAGAIPPELVQFTAYPDVTRAPKAVTPTGFSNPPGWADNRLDGTWAVASVDGDPATPAPDSASVLLADYDGTDLKADATIDVAVLRVRHRDAGTVRPPRVSVRVDGDLCIDQVELAASPAGQPDEDQISLGTCGGKLANPAELDTVEVTYTVDVDPLDPLAAATYELDGITLELLSGPLVRASMAFDRDQATVQAWSVTR